MNNPLYQNSINLIGSTTLLVCKKAKGNDSYKRKYKLVDALREKKEKKGLRKNNTITNEKIRKKDLVSSVVFIMQCPK